MHERRKLILALSCVVVFLTTYMLILPAFTLDKEKASEQGGIDVPVSEESVDADLTSQENAADESEKEASGTDGSEAAESAETAKTDSSEEAKAEDADKVGKESSETSVKETPENAGTTAAKEAEKDSSSEVKTETANSDKPETEKPAESGTANLAKSESANTESADGASESNASKVTLQNDESDDFVVAVEGKDAGLSEDMSIKVREIDQSTKKLKKEYDSLYGDALEAVQDEEGLETPSGFAFAKFYDISIMNGKREVEPDAAVDVKISFGKKLQKELKVADPERVHVIHFTEDKQTGEVTPEVLDTKDTDITVENNKVTEAAFTADSFSVFAVVYTVDFHYEANGETYDFSIPGGGFVSFYDLVKTLGVEADDANTEKDEIQELVDGVESIKFSDPELVSVSKVEEDTTAGAIKERLGLECEYSADLTEEQIEDINSQKIKAGEWALISLKPFDSEESLTVTMKNGDQWTVKVTDAQISTHVITAKGEHFRITVTFDEDAKIPYGSMLVAREILEGTEEYEKYLEETADQWEEAEREGFISYARFFDLEIQKDGKKIEPEAPVEVEIDHEDGFTLFNDESLSVIHFAGNGTEIIDELHRNEDGTEIVYEQTGFSVIGTVSTVKDSGWPTANGQYVLVMQDGDDYYALKQDGTLEKVRYFNNTVSFIGEGTTTTDYINDYLWHVVSSGNRGKISDEYTEYNATPAGQTFIDPYSTGILSGTSRQLQIRDGKIYCSGQLPGSSSFTQVSLSASGGQLSRVELTSNSASRVFFATASSFTANDNETDLFTQEEVESIIAKWKEQKTKDVSYDKTAEVYDYENRIYQVDVTASSSDYEVSPSIALEFVVDASRSMFFPTSLTQVGTFNGTEASNVRDWINSNGNRDQVYFVIQDKNGKATQYAIFYDPNSEYTVNEPYWNGWRWVDNYVTRHGQWLWCDASVYNPPDDVSNGGTQNSMQSGLPLSDWDWGNMDDGKIYTTDITGSSNGTYGTRKTWISRIEYLKQCARVASQVIYAVDEDAQIGLIGFNASVTDYGTFGKNQQQALLNNIDNISLAGGTNHQAGLQKAIDKYRDPSFYAQHYAGRKHVVVLVTDGAPNATGVNWTTIGNVANTLKGLTDDFDHNTELYTMGLSLTNVGSNQSNLFNISSGSGYTYAGEDAAQIINAVTKIVDSIFVQANLVADVTDVIDPAFYPVDKATGLPLAENDWIKLDGSKVGSGASDAAGQIKKDSSTGNWYVEWKNQSIDWPTTNSSGSITEPGWHGTVFVKVKEDFLGGNGISTNAAGSKLEAKKYIVRWETTPHDLPQGDHTATFETPYVNIDELDITKNDTEWTVYLGTNVDPLQELKALWEKVKVKEVVSKSDSDHRLASDGNLTYQYASNTNDNRQEVNGREEFPLSDLGITLTDDDWTDLIAGNSKTFTYSAYDHSSVGTITISLTQAVAEGENNLAESPHDTTVTGNAVEKYTLSVSYRPAGANISDWHTGSYGSGMSGSRAGNIRKDNTHIINVFVKGLQITKVDLNDQILPGAKFALYRTARAGETDLLEIEGGQYYKVADFDTSSNGIAVKEQIEQLEEGEQYYLVETEVPAGYITISPIPVNLSISDEYIPKPGSATQPTKPETGIFDWTQTASLILSAESGVKQTDADNTIDLTHSGTANSNTETIYYRITNNPGVELPSTGGPGTRLFTILGSSLILLSGVMLWRRRRLN